MQETVSVGGVIINQDKEIIVVSQQGRSWSLPKGHQEEGESLLETAYREIEEETGLSELDYICHLGSYSRYRLGLDGRDDMSEKKTIHLFLFRSEKETLCPQDSDNPEAAWVSINEACSRLSHPKDKAFLEKVSPLLCASMDDLIEVTVSAVSLEEAELIAKAVLDSQLAACCQVGSSVSSYYHWKGTLEQSEEVICTIKTVASCFSDLEKVIKEQHSYECPEIIAKRILWASEDYAQWLRESVAIS